MATNRRQFIKKSVLGTAAVPLMINHIPSETSPEIEERYKKLDEIASKPVFKQELFSDPVIIASLELLRYEDSFLCRVRSKDGAEGISVSNNDQMKSLYPVFVHRLQPYFIGKDARKLEKLLDEVYVYQSNYKLQGLALWIPLATIEFAILDLFGRMSSKPIGDLIGSVKNREIAVYQANNYRGKTAEESIVRIKKNVEETQAKALKFKVGGRMSNNADDPPGRTEKLIPLIRKTFGDKMVVYADSNGSYDAKEAIRIGKLLEEYRFDFYEEPTPFDWYEETRQVADALTIPIAGGEQEPSLHSFRWLIANDALQIIQPDIFYFGGMIRSMKVARMAEAFGKACTPHISGNGIGYLYMMHFVSAVSNAGPFHEFKGFNKELPYECKTSKLDSDGGVVTVPSGPGLGIEIDPDYISKHKIVKA
ncbi:MAG: mandelate racemase/muconate lactonizing enzyme family protein [Prolixibacteraceae bacterium]|nr:mandelate racemase/muconate lactonizing enzyme family protein [Prolixibacteraceae bacterium]